MRGQYPEDTARERGGAMAADFNRKTMKAVTWKKEPWTEGDKLDAYVWVPTATFVQIKNLRKLIPPTIPPTGAKGKGYVRKVLVLAGPYDVLVGVTADSRDDLEKLVLGPIHTIVKNSETSISIWPKGESGQGGDNPGPHPYGAIWPPPAIPDAMIRVQVSGDLETTYHELYKNMDTFMAESVMGTGDHQILLELGSGTHSDVLQDITKVSGIQGVSGFTSHWVLKGPQ
jgi:hypothetical protein